jgi:hypothetical protein
MSTNKKQKKSFFSKWRKVNIADGLSTTFFELKLHSSPRQPDASKSLQQPAEKELKEDTKQSIQLEAPLHLMNGIV